MYSAYRYIQLLCCINFHSGWHFWIHAKIWQCQCGLCWAPTAQQSCPLNYVQQHQHLYGQTAWPNGHDLVCMPAWGGCSLPHQLHSMESPIWHKPWLQCTYMTNTRLLNSTFGAFWGDGMLRTRPPLAHSLSTSCLLCAQRRQHEECQTVLVLESHHQAAIAP